MAGQLHTVAEAAAILKVRESWLKTKAAARLIPCTFVGKHLRFSDDDIAEIMKAGRASRSPHGNRERGAQAHDSRPSPKLPPQSTRDGVPRHGPWGGHATQ